MNNLIKKLTTFSFLLNLIVVAGGNLVPYDEEQDLNYKFYNLVTQSVSIRNTSLLMEPGNDFFEQYFNLLEELIDAGANVNFAPRAKFKHIWINRALLHYDLDTEVTQLLIDSGADVNLPLKLGQERESVKPLFFASTIEEFTMIIAAGGDITDLDYNGNNVMVNFFDNEAILQLGLNAGLEINSKFVLSKHWFGGVRDQTPLHLAVYSSANTVQFLINNGADVNAVDYRGETPISLVSEVDVLNILLNAGADINAPDRDGKTLLHDTSIELATRLIEAGAQVNVFDLEKKTPLVYWSLKSAIVTELLISAGANLNWKNKYSKNLLFFVQSPEICQLLIDSGININEPDFRGVTPLENAIANHRHEIAAVLIAAGALQ